MVSNAGNHVAEANKRYLNKINNMIKGIDVLKEFGALNFYQDFFSQELFKIKNSRVLLAKETSKVTFIIFLLNVIGQLSVILLDESFSSIDIVSSKMILNSLSKLENTMVIIITHRKQELEDIEYDSIDIFKLYLLLKDNTFVRCLDTISLFLEDKKVKQ